MLIRFLFFGLFLSLSPLCAQDWAPLLDDHVYYYTRLNTWTSHSLLQIQEYSYGDLRNTRRITGLSIASPHTSSPALHTLMDVAAVTPLEVNARPLHSGQVNYEYHLDLAACDTCTIPQIGVQYLKFNRLFPKLIQATSRHFHLIAGMDTIILPSSPHSSIPPQQYVLTQDSLRWSTVLYSVSDSVAYWSVYDTSGPVPQLLYQFAIAKNYGLVNWVQNHAPFFSTELWGRQHARTYDYAGLHSMKYDEIFDFAVGDQFYYLMEGHIPGSAFHEYRYRLRVLSKDTSTIGTIRYQLERRVYSGYGHVYPPIMPPSGVDTIMEVYTNAPDQLYNAFPHTRHLRPSSYPPLTETLCHDFFFSTRPSKYIGHNKGLRVQQLPSPSYRFHGYYNHFDSIGPDLYQAVNSGVDCYATLYQKGLGRVYYHSAYWEGFQMIYLEGYIKGTDTVGHTPIIVGTSERATPVVTLSAHPNPVQDQLYVQLASSASSGAIQPLTLSVVDGKGVEWNVQSIQPYTSVVALSVHRLPAQWYALVLRQGEQVIGHTTFVKR